MFIQVIEGRVADADKLSAAVDRWHEDVRPGAVGWLGTTAGVTEDGRSIALIRFESEEAARANSDRPEQTAWWTEMSANFTGEPTFSESSDVDADVVGDPDTAGFVQVMRGQTTDAARARELMNDDSVDWRGMRPDILATVSINEPDGRWTMAAYFTSEAAAREAEAKEMPEAAQKVMAELMSLSVGEPSYFDLKDPWLRSA